AATDSFLALVCFCSAFMSACARSSVVLFLFEVRHRKFTLRPRCSSRSGRLMRKFARSLLCVVLPMLGGVSVLAGCARRVPEERELPKRSHFIALTRNFAEFRSWGWIDVDAQPAQ